MKSGQEGRDKDTKNERGKTVLVCKWYDSLPRKSERISRRTIKIEKGFSRRAIHKNPVSCVRTVKQFKNPWEGNSFTLATTKALVLTNNEMKTSITLFKKVKNKHLNK